MDETTVKKCTTIFPIVQYQVSKEWIDTLLSEFKRAVISKALETDCSKKFLASINELKLQVEDDAQIKLFFPDGFDPNLDDAPVKGILEKPQSAKETGEKSAENNSEVTTEPASQPSASEEEPKEPSSSEAESSENPESTEATEDNPEATEEKKKQILIVDDEFGPRVLAQNTLAAEDREVLVAENIEEGLKTFEENQANIYLVILPMVILEMLGETEDIFKKIREAKPNLPILYTTGTEETTETPACLKDQENIDFIPKPLRQDDFVAKAQKLLES